MGGPGSGRYAYSNRRTTESYLSIDIRRWAREGMLKTGNFCYWRWSKAGKPYSAIAVQTSRRHLILSYRGERQQIAQQQTIRLNWTDCHLGGSRAWFLCPSPDCGRRVAILYFRRLFGCRNCLGLRYKSQLETELDKAARRANWKREKLGWPAGILNPPGSRPKGMHRRSYFQLVGKYLKNLESAHSHIERANIALSKKLK